MVDGSDVVSVLGLSNESGVKRARDPNVIDLDDD
jgi:hypothetical protein